LSNLCRRAGEWLKISQAAWFNSVGHMTIAIEATCLNSVEHAETSEQLPLAVDLDGTLIKVDTLHEGFIDCIKRQPLAWAEYARMLSRGKAAFKREIASRTAFDPALLPYNEKFLDYLRREKRAGRRIGLFSAADQTIADKIANYLGIFDVVRGSDGSVNLRGDAKAQAIRETFGERFAYAGNDQIDRSIFDMAQQVVLVGDVNRLRSYLTHEKPVEAAYVQEVAGVGAWVKALRLEHWAKNVLVFVAPILAFQITSPAVLLEALLLFMSFGVLASATYLVNDLFDLSPDRQHPYKRFRPFAAGTIPVRHGAMVAVLLIAVAFGFGFVLPWACLAALGAYLVLTLAYSLVLKQQPIIDVVVLSGLFTLRVLAGSFLVPVPFSHWLLTFSMLFFLSLAMVKRFAELDRIIRPAGSSIVSRGYTAKDLPLLLATGVASGFAAIVIFTIYLINEQYPSNIYRNPQLLWAMMPILLVWILRTWHITGHGRMHDDPVVFAVRDPFSIALGIIVVGVLAAAWVWV
jgi:4-hydroxybenzoate polyprenyltransferase